MTPETSSRLRLVVSLLILGFAGVGLFFAMRRDPPAPQASTEFERIRDAILTGDHRALWRSMDPVARASYAEYVQRLRSSAPPEEIDRYCKTVSISRKELAELPFDAILAREIGVSAEDFRGARVVRAYPQVDRPGEEVLQLGFREGRERWWHMALVDGAWTVRNLNAIVTADGLLTGSDGNLRQVIPKAPKSLGGGRR